MKDTLISSFLQTAKAWLKEFTESSAALYLIILLIGSSISSCAPGKNTAARFVQKAPEKAVMIAPPAFTFLYHYPYEFFDDDVSEEQFRNIENSYFLKELDMEIADSVFFHSLIHELKRFSFRVFTPEDFDEFLTHDGSRYIFTMAQTELVEFDQPHTDRALIDTTLYRQDFLLRTVERNAWFEFVEVDAFDTGEDSGMLVLFSTFFTSDEVDGRFRYRPLTGEVVYEYNSRIIDINDVYELQRFAGMRNARYIAGFLMDNYVRENARPIIGKPAVFRYNPATNTLRTIRRSTEEFILLE